MRLLLATILCIGYTPDPQGSPEATLNTRDRQVLETVLLHLLKDKDLKLTRTSSEMEEIVLHRRTPEKTGYLASQQIRGDVDDHSLPAEVEEDLRRRNTPIDAKPDTYDAVEVNFSHATFVKGIVVADLTKVWKGGRSFRAFEEAHPNGRCWIESYLPGYSKDGNQAVVRAFIGPSAHGATVTALLEKRGDHWIVKWHRVAFYA